MPPASQQPVSTLNPAERPGRRRAAPRGLLTLLLLGLAATAAAETRYVSDELLITFRTQPSNRAEIIRNLTTGTAVEIIEEPANGEWVLVRLRDGRQGWVRGQYLMREPVARDRLEAANRDVERLTRANADLREQLDAAQSGRSSAEQDNASLSATVSQLQEELAEIKRVSAGALETASENQRLKELNARLRAELDEMVAQRDQLSANVEQRWLLAGGGLVLAGLILGILLKARPRRSAWT